MDTALSLEDYGINQAGNLLIQDALADHVNKAFSDATIHKRSIGIEARLLRNLRANKCEYQPDEVGLLGPFNDVYMGISALKARAAESWLTDIILNNIDRPWTLEPTPNPEIPEAEKEDVVSILLSELPNFGSVEALRARARDLKAASNTIAYAKSERATQKMETKIADQMAEGEWTPTFAKLIADIVVYPTALMRGPIVIGKTVGAWDGKKYKAEKQHIPIVRSISPFDAFPAPNAVSPNDGEYFCERVAYNAGQLYNLIGVDGFNAGNIRQAIDDHPEGYKLEIIGDAERKRLEDKANVLTPIAATNAGKDYDTIIYNGRVKGEFLAKHGIIVKDQQNTYECEVWLIENMVIRAVLNPNPTGTRPVYASSYRKIVGSFWGQSVIDLTYDVNRVGNAAARSLVRNMAYSSGPIGEVVAERVTEVQDPTDIQPYRVVAVGPDLSGTGAPAYKFHNVDSIANDLMAVFDKYMKMADDLSGVPSYVLGNPQVAGAGRTLGGLSMLMGNAAKGIKNVQLNIDRDIISGIVLGFFVYNMVTSDDDSIKSDATVVARGATGLLQRELAQTRTVELLQLLAPYIENWEGLPDGIKIMLREVLKTTGLPVDQIIPDPNKQEEGIELIKTLGGGVPPGGQMDAMQRGNSAPVPLPPQSMPPAMPQGMPQSMPPMQSLPPQNPTGSALPINMPTGA